MRASRGLKWENEMYKLKRSIPGKVLTSSFWFVSNFVAFESNTYFFLFVLTQVTQSHSLNAQST